MKMTGRGSNASHHVNSCQVAISYLFLLNYSISDQLCVWRDLMTSHKGTLRGHRGRKLAKHRSKFEAVHESKVPRPRRHHSQGWWPCSVQGLGDLRATHRPVVYCGELGVYRGMY